MNELVTRGLGRIVGDLAGMGYGCRWGMFRAKDVGLCHRRKRIFLLAHSSQERLYQTPVQTRNIHENIREQEGRTEERRRHFGNCFANFPSEETFAGIRGNDDVMAEWMVRLETIGDGQVPSVVKLAWETLIGNL